MSRHLGRDMVTVRFQITLGQFIRHTGAAGMIVNVALILECNSFTERGAMFDHARIHAKIDLSSRPRNRTDDRDDVQFEEKEVYMHDFHNFGRHIRVKLKNCMYREPMKSSEND